MLPGAGPGWAQTSDQRLGRIGPGVLPGLTMRIPRCQEIDAAGRLAPDTPASRPLPHRSGLDGRSRARLGGSVLADAELARKEAKTPRATEDGRPWVSRADGLRVPNPMTRVRPHLPEIRIARLPVGSPRGFT